MVRLGLELARLSGCMALSRAIRPASGCFLTFHRVAPHEQWPHLPNRDFYVDAKFLGELLDHLLRTGYDIVTIDDALARARAGRGVRRWVNFSIDDVYRDTWALAVPIFSERNVPVTLFVTTGIPDRTALLWQAGLETILLEQDQVSIAPGSVVNTESDAQKRAMFSQLTTAWESDGPADHYAEFCGLNGYDDAQLHERHAVTWEMLDSMRDNPCVEIGGHTVTHPRLSALPAEAAEWEIAECRRRLQDRLGLPVKHFAFPYGRRGDCGEREFALTRKAGYEAAATTRKGLVKAADPAPLHALPRNTLNGSWQRLSQIELHLSGLGGFVARMMGTT